MEIVLPGANIDSLIDSQIKSQEDLKNRILAERNTAEETAIIALVRQFQNEFSTFVDTAIQSSLPLQFLPPKEVSIFSVCCYFLYLEVGVYIRRNLSGWEINYLEESVSVQPDALQKQLLIELSKIRNKANHT